MPKKILQRIPLKMSLSIMGDIDNAAKHEERTRSGMIRCFLQAALADRRLTAKPSMRLARGKSENSMYLACTITPVLFRAVEMRTERECRTRAWMLRSLLKKEFAKELSQIKDEAI